MTQPEITPRRRNRTVAAVLGVSAVALVVAVLAFSIGRDPNRTIDPVTASSSVTTADTGGNTTTTAGTGGDTTTTADARPTTTAGVPTATGTPSPCTASDFTVVATGPGDSAMGNIKWTVSLTNVSGAACVLPASAALAGVGADGAVTPVDTTFGGTYFGNPPVVVGPLPAGAVTELWLGGSSASLCQESAASIPKSSWASMLLRLPDGSNVALPLAIESCGVPGISTFGRPPSGAPQSGRICPAPLAITDIVQTTANQAAYDVDGLQADLQTAVAYGAAHPDDWAGLEITADQPARIRIWVTDHLDANAADLGALLDHPERVDMSLASYSRDDLAKIVDTIIADAQANPTEFTSFPAEPPAGQVVDIGLARGQEALADAYINRYGTEIRIHVGALAYVPTGCGTAPMPLACPDLVGQDPATANLSLAVTAHTATITQSGFGTATLTVTNTGAAAVQVESDSPLLGTLVYSGTTRVAAFGGSSKGTGIQLNLSPGESGDIPVTFATDRCDGQPGSVIPPGTYGLRVALPATPGTTDPGSILLSPEVAVTVTEG